MRDYQTFKTLSLSRTQVIRLLKNALFAGEGGGASKYRRDEIATVKFFRYCE